MPLNENDKTEFKESFDHEDFEAEVVSFLNEEGGTIYLGVAKDGTAKGVKDIDRTMIMISDSLLDRIAPDCSELTSIHEDVVDEVKVIRVEVEKGYGLFHIKKYGHSPKGCYRLLVHGKSRWNRMKSTDVIGSASPRQRLWNGKARKRN